MASELEESIRNQIKLQRQNQKSNQQMAQNMAKGYEATPDLSPLAGLVDAWTGSQFSRSMPQQETAEDRMRLINYYNQQAAQSGQSALKSEMGLLKQLGKNSKGSKGKDLTANMVKKLNEGNAIPDMLSNLHGTIKDNSDLFGPISGRMASANPYNTQAQKVDAELRAKSQAFGKFMEGGVLRKEDEEKYRKMFPNLSDTKEVAEEKLTIVDDILRQRQASDLEAFKAQNYDLTGLELPEKKGSKKSSGPKTGAVESGYEFLGGDPGDQSNWRKK